MDGYWYAARTLDRHRLFTGAVVLTLALAISVSSVVVSAAIRAEWINRFFHESVDADFLDPAIEADFPSDMSAYLDRMCAALPQPGSHLTDESLPPKTKPTLLILRHVGLLTARASQQPELTQILQRVIGAPSA